MPIVIRKMYIRTVVERRIVTEAEFPEEVLRKIESRVAERLAEENESDRPAVRRQRKRNER